MNDPIPLGEALDRIGVTWEPDDPGDIITDAIIIAKVSGGDGDTSVVYELSDGMDWVTRLGLMEAGRQIEAMNSLRREDDE